ncbi:MAG: tetratricopeptide repeat protein, partial [Deltaproteobacteria bacterium]|nr:tetratricopeptide repeat protein [Deltaproteobacteria bacterium]
MGETRITASSFRRVIVYCFLILLPLTLTGRSTPLFAYDLQKSAISTPSLAASPSFSLPQPVSWDDFELAVRLYHRGRLQEAAELLDKIYCLKLTVRQNRLIRFLRGVIASRLGQHDVVLKAFPRNIGVLSGLKSYVLYYQAHALFGLKRWPKARVQFSSYINLYPDGILNHQARLLKVESLVHQGRTDQAIKGFYRLTPNDQAGEVYLGLARALENRGKMDAARTAFQKAMKHARSATVRSEASAKYKELLWLSLIEANKEVLYLEVVRLLFKEWRLKEALALTEHLLDQGGSSEYLDELALEKGRALLYLNQLDHAQRHFYGAAQSATVKYKAELWGRYARCLSRQGLFEEAASAFVLSGQTATSKKEADAAYFLAGALFLKADKIARAEEAWRRIRKWVRQGRLADDILWYVAWYYYRHHAWKMAAERFFTLNRKYPRRASGQAARYWLARTLEHMDRQPKAVEHYLALAIGQNHDYYRILSLERLRQIRPQGSWSVHPGTTDLRPPESLKFNEIFQPACVSVSPKDNFLPSSPEPSFWPHDLWAERAQIINLKRVPHASGRLNLALARLKNLAAAGTLDLAVKEAADILELIPSEKRQNATILTRPQKKRRDKELKRARRQLYVFVSAYLAERGHYYQYVKLHEKYASLWTASSHKEKFKARRLTYPLS